MVIFASPILIILYSVSVASGVLGLCFKKAEFLLFLSGLLFAVFSLVALIASMSLSELSTWLVLAVLSGFIVRKVLVGRRGV